MLLGANHALRASEFNVVHARPLSSSSIMAKRLSWLPQADHQKS